MYRFKNTEYVAHFKISPQRDVKQRQNSKVSPDSVSRHFINCLQTHCAASSFMRVGENMWRRLKRTTDSTAYDQCLHTLLAAFDSVDNLVSTMRLPGEMKDMDESERHKKILRALVDHVEMFSLSLKSLLKI